MAVVVENKKRAHRGLWRHGRGKSTRTTPVIGPHCTQPGVGLSITTTPITLLVLSTPYSLLPPLSLSFPASPCVCQRSNPPMPVHAFAPPRHVLLPNRANEGRVHPRGLGALPHAAI